MKQIEATMLEVDPVAVMPYINTCLIERECAEILQVRLMVKSWYLPSFAVEKCWLPDLRDELREEDGKRMARHGPLGRDFTFFCLEEALLGGCSLRLRCVSLLTPVSSVDKVVCKKVAGAEAGWVALSLIVLTCMSLCSPGSCEETSGALQGATLW